MNDNLTKRELQVAEFIAWGANRKEIPDLLVSRYGGKAPSINTINNTIANIYAKLSLNSETELSAWYFCTYHGVDSSKSPIKKVRRKIYAFIMLLVILPQIANLDQAIRPARTSVRTSRTQSRTRRSEDDNQDTYNI